MSQSTAATDDVMLTNVVNNSNNNSSPVVKRTYGAVTAGVEGGGGLFAISGGRPGDAAVTRVQNTYLNGHVAPSGGGGGEYLQISDGSVGGVAGSSREMAALPAGDEGDHPTTAEEDHHCHRAAAAADLTARNQLIVVSVLCCCFMVAEIVGGVLSNSLALVTDATHMASDLTGFMVSLFALWVARKPATTRMSFGFYRAEILGALVSILIIWLATAVLVFFAVDRIRHNDYDIQADEMLIVAALGVAFNIVMGLVLHSGLCRKCSVPHSHFGGGHGHSHGGHSHLEEEVSSSHDSHVGGDDESTVIIEPTESPPRPRNINVRAAMIHVVGDLIQSVGVLIAAIIIKVQPDYKIADPICTFVFSVLVMITTVTVLRDVLLVLLEAVPRNVDYTAMRADLAHLPGVRGVHSLNVWSLTMDKVAVAVHIAVDADVNWDTVLEEATKLLRTKYHVFQSTIQVERFQHNIMSSCEECLGPRASRRASRERDC